MTIFMNESRREDKAYEVQRITILLSIYERLGEEILNAVDSSTKPFPLRLYS